MRAALLAAAVLLLLPAGAAAAPSLVKVGDFSSPVDVAAPPGDAARVFVVEQSGHVKLLVGGQKQAADFLDVSPLVTTSNPEQGLLSIAFPPDYATSGLFYVFFTAKPGALGVAVANDLVVLEGRRSAADPDRADAAYRRIVLRIAHPSFGNHNGGLLLFGPDGRLYVGTGDGGMQGANPNAQNANLLLGKLLRIDPHPTATATYGIPADNPGFPRPEIWALGLRNPWRYSFDRQTGDLAIGDVGNNAREEVDFVRAPAAGKGLNFGWNCIEGTMPTGICSVTGATPPAFDMAHDDGYSSVIGGFVVRDPGVPSLLGRYVYGDIAKNTLYSVGLGAPKPPQRMEDALAVSFPSSFGEDACGHVYVASHDGPVYRLQEGAVSACGLPQGSGGQPLTAPSVDARPCVVRVRYPGRQRILRRHARLRLTVGADEACRVRLRAKRFRARIVSLKAGKARVVWLTPTREGRRSLRASLRRHGSVRLSVRLTAVDAAGNALHRRVRPRVRS